MVEAARRVSAAREAILARIRAVDRLAGSPIHGEYRRAGNRNADARVELFAERAADYRADVRLVAAGIAAAVETALADHDAARVVVPPGLPAHWRPGTVNLVEDHGLTPRELAAFDGVVTGCTLVIAETGTIVLSGAAEEGRRALSLVPDLHVCVVRRKQIVELVPEAFARIDGRRALTFVSGPSATSDIELSRVEGVHGPRTLVILIVEEEHE